MKNTVKETVIWYVPWFIALSFPLVVGLLFLQQFEMEISSHTVLGSLFEGYILAVPLCAFWTMIQSLVRKTKSDRSRRFAFYSGLGVLLLFLAGLACPAL